MKIILKWKIEKENIPISACAVDPVHDRVIIGVKKAVVMLDIKTGEEIKKGEKHSADISCLAYRKDGLMFASGG